MPQGPRTPAAQVSAGPAGPGDHACRPVRITPGGGPGGTSSSWRSRGSWGGAGLGGQGEGQRPAVDGRGALVGDRDGGGEAGVPGVHGVGDLAGAGRGSDGGGGGGAAAGVAAEEAGGLGGQ